MKDTFDAVPISMSFVSEIKAMFVTSSLKRNRAIDKKGRVIYVVFVAEFCERLICEHVFFIVGSGFVWNRSFESGSTAAYSQYCSSSS